MKHKESFDGPNEFQDTPRRGNRSREKFLIRSWVRHYVGPEYHVSYQRFLPDKNHARARLTIAPYIHAGTSWAEDQATVFEFWDQSIDEMWFQILDGWNRFHYNMS